MTEIYAGYGLNKTYIGFCENGNIYMGYGINKTCIGTYTNNEIYKGYGLNKTYIGFYDERNVYEGSRYNKTFIGDFNGGNINKGYGSSKELFVGSYIGNEGGAASAAFLLLLYSNFKSLNDTIPPKKEHSSSSSSSGSGSGGGGGNNFVIGFLLLFVIGLVATIFSQHPEYLTMIFYVLIPGIFLLASIILLLLGKRKIAVKNFLGGAVAGFAIMFVVVLVVNAFIHKYSNIQVLDEDLGIICGFVITMITSGIFMSKNIC